MRHLIMRLEAPLMSFGGETIDSLGITRRFPPASMLTGLLANALGWRRVEARRHQDLQDRLVFAARIDQEPPGRLRMTDFQSAAINNTEQSWTTRGKPEGRAGGTYQNHLRWRDYFADMRVIVALRLEPVGQAPTLDDLANALQEPVRRLFIGRKPALPSAPLFGRFSDGHTALAALLSVPLSEDRISPDRIGLLWARRRGRRPSRTESFFYADRPAQLDFRSARRRALGARGNGNPRTGLAVRQRAKPRLRLKRKGSNDHDGYRKARGSG